MVTASQREYVENRRALTYQDLAPYQGQWVAFSRDGKKILASDKSIAALGQRLDKDGLDPEEYTLEPIPDLDKAVIL